MIFPDIKVLILALTLLTGSSFHPESLIGSGNPYSITTSSTNPLDISEFKPTNDLYINKNDIINTLIFIESTYNNNAYVSSTGAAGPLQIRPILLNDINRIVGYNKYSLDDRFNRKKSIEMFNIYINYYELNTVHKISRCWYGGPNGYKNNNTLVYWKKVLINLPNIYNVAAENRILLI
jgi:hypothetical protein